MDLHSEQHEALLERLAVGDLPPTAREITHLFAACGVCREKWARLEELQAKLASAAVEERAGVAAAAGGQPTPAQERRIAEFVGARTGAKARGPRRMGLLVLALAAGVGGVVLYRAWSPKEAIPEDVMLDTKDELRALPARPGATALLPLEWTSPPLEPGESFRLRLWRSASAAGSTLTIEGLQTTAWDASAKDPAKAAEIAAFFAPGLQQIQWQVELCDVTGTTRLRSQVVRFPPQ